MSDFSESLAEEVKIRMKELQMSKAALARVSKTSVYHVNKVLNADDSVKFFKACRIASAVGLDVELRVIE